MAFNLFKKKKEEDEFGDDELGGLDSELPPLPPLDENDDLGDEELPPLPEPAPRGMPRVGTIPRVPSPVQQRPAKPYADGRAKVFVRIDKYRDIMKTIDSMQDKLNNLNQTIDTISSIKQKEQQIVEGWHALLSDAKAKVDEIHSKLTRPAE